MELKNKKAIYCNTMLQFDTNVDASVNGPLNFDGDVDANADADVTCEHNL